MSHITDTRLTVDEWSAQHLPLTQVALAAAVPIIEAEVREKVARDIEALEDWGCRYVPGGCDCRRSEAVRDAAAIARGAS